MKPFDLLLTSLQNLWRRKLRTILTMTGVTIGTVSIVIMISLGLGMNDQYIEDMEKSGQLTFVEVYNNSYYDSRSSSQNHLNEKKLAEIRNLPGVKAATPVIYLYVGRLKTGKNEYQGSIMGIDPTWFTANGYVIENGRSFDTESKEFEIVLGQGSKRNFRDPNERIDWRTYDWNAVPDIDWLGSRYQYILTSWDNNTGESSQKKLTAKVVGELIESYGNENYYAFCSLDAIKNMAKKNRKVFENYNISFDNYEQVWVKTNSVDDTMAVQEAINEMGYQAWSSAEYIIQQKETQRTIQLFLGAIGLVAMVVAAISIANTMLMSIYERTKEIGVMKVLGCKLSNIGALFLGEAALIGLIGGLLGVGVSFGLSIILNKSLSLMAGLGTSFSSQIPLWLAAVGLLFSTFVGIIAGLYPSQRAMRLSALAAIRNEA